MLKVADDPPARTPPGHRWVVYYRDFTEGEAPPLRWLVVAGAMTAEVALGEARLALASPDHEDLEIIAVVRGTGHGAN